MPQDRLRHQRAGHSQKLTALTDFEYRVWDQYQLSADDFGIMRCSPLAIQAGNDALAQRPQRLIQKALERLIEVGLVKAFEHQAVRYICDPVWQYFQKVDYPKQTINPVPPDAVLAECHPLTRELFRQCFGKPSTKFRVKAAEDSGKDSGEFDAIARVRAGEEAEAKANGKGKTGNPTNAELRGMARVVDGPHPHHALCGRPCIHNRQYREFISKLGGDETTAAGRIDAFFDKVQAKYAGKPIPTADDFKLWNAEYDIEFGQPVPGQTRASAVPTAEETLARQRQLRNQAS